MPAFASSPSANSRPSAATKSKDADVLATNDSSIVSKRSAERLHYFSEEQFLRHFVPNPRRRAPLINLGYAIRSYLVDRIIQGFLEICDQQTAEIDNPVAVVNLGAGSDPSFFRVVNRRSRGRQLLWIDCDFPDLTERKRGVIAASEELRSILPDISQDERIRFSHSTKGNALFALLGCDLCDTSTTASRIVQLVPTETTVLFVSEVATVYMPAEASDSLLECLAGFYKRGAYACLEQTLPKGELQSAFVTTMLRHFDKNVRTPLHGTLSYPTVDEQLERLHKLGWSSVQARTLYLLWHDSRLSSGPNDVWTRMTKTESFDEWEELDLFLSHYYIGLAINPGSPLLEAPEILPGLRGDVNAPTPVNLGGSGILDPLAAVPRPTAWFQKSHDAAIRRRGHTCTPISDTDCLIFGGFGTIQAQSKSSSTGHMRLAHPTVLSFSASSKDGNLIPLPADPAVPQPRVYHSATFLTAFGQKFVAVYGGRSGPRTTFDDLHLFDCANRTWSVIGLGGSLRPCGRYRHMSCSLGPLHPSKLLVHGGLDCENQILEDAWIFDLATTRWTPLPGVAQQLGPRYCHSACFLDNQVIVSGGILPRHSSQRRLGGVECFAVSADETMTPLASHPSYDALDPRYGHTMVPWPSAGPGALLLAGGITYRGAIPPSDQIVLLSPTRCPAREPLMLDFPRLLVNHTLSFLRLPTLPGSSRLTNVAVIVGGGATCFSFGSRFDTEVTLLTDQGTSPFCTPTGSDPVKSPPASTSGTETWNKPIYLQRNVAPTRALWLEALAKGQPAVFADTDIGSCKYLWTPDYLRQQCGNKKVSVHISKASESLQWHNKNFRYVTMPFGELISRTLDLGEEASTVAIGGRELSDSTSANSPRKEETLYLRSLSSSAKKPANLTLDFPEMAQDFRVPALMRAEVEQRFFSSPLRISGPELRMWAHYDASDNILAQVRGRKVVKLWPPKHVENLYIEGSSSKIPDLEHPDFAEFPLYRVAQPFEVTLEPGDVLFIPALWLHSTKCVSACGSVSVNVFFRSAPAALYSATDVWSNQDLLPFQDALRALEGVKEKLNVHGLEPAQRAFYLRKLSMALSAEACKAEQ